MLFMDDAQLYTTSHYIIVVSNGQPCDQTLPQADLLALAKTKLYFPRCSKQIPLSLELKKSPETSI